LQEAKEKAIAEETGMRTALALDLKRVKRMKSESLRVSTIHNNE